MKPRPWPTLVQVRPDLTELSAERPEQGSTGQCESDVDVFVPSGAAQKAVGAQDCEQSKARAVDIKFGRLPTKVEPEISSIEALTDSSTKEGCSVFKITLVDGFTFKCRTFKDAITDEYLAQTPHAYTFTHALGWYEDASAERKALLDVMWLDLKTVTLLTQRYTRKITSLSHPDGDALEDAVSGLKAGTYIVHLCGTPSVGDGDLPVYSGVLEVSDTKEGAETVAYVYHDVSVVDAAAVGLVASQPKAISDLSKSSQSPKSMVEVAIDFATLQTRHGIAMHRVEIHRVKETQPGQ